MEETKHCHKYGRCTSLNLRTVLKHLFPIKNTNLSHYDILRKSKLVSALKALGRMWKRGIVLRIRILRYV